ncbi:MAG: hypothetical protein H7A45_19430 [Verrucomicrobiales bacterium]|nr:hypothetical protein [Verrucomicrobiales bacterium]MCP5526995.1 hypothetical protein [Verrucomicrobiales bacterium]
MKPAWLPHLGRWLRDHGRLRRPFGSASSTEPARQPSAAIGTEWARDMESFREIVARLDALETRLEHSEILDAAAGRGYFTPAEDDRVRQSLLAYRNYRLALYDLIFRYEDYRRIASPRLRLRIFALVYSVALNLYARSLQLIQVAEYHPLLRAKLNEPDAKFGLEAGFFDDVLAGYSSLRHYRRLAAADWYWVRHRGALRRTGLLDETDVAWLCDRIRRQRLLVRRRLFHILWTRLRGDWRQFVRSIVSPVWQTRYELRALVGGRFAGLWLHPEPQRVLDQAVLNQLRPRLRAGDILLVRAEGKLTSALLPGFWAHAAIYVGSRAELAALPLEECPHLRRHLDRLSPDGGPSGMIIEAVSPRVRLTSLAECLEGDHVLGLRLELPDRERAAALNEAFGHLDKPYDFEFDFNVSTRVVCTELVYRAYHGRAGLDLPLVKRLGRYTLTGDDLAHLALDCLEGKATGSPAPLSVVALVLRRRDGLARFVEPSRAISTLRRIRAGWRPFRRDRLRSPNATPP